MKEILTQLFGEAVTEDALKQFNAELGKKFVAKRDYNSKIEKIKTLEDANSSLENKITELNEKSNPAEDYKSQLEKLQKEIKEKADADKAAAEDAALTEATVKEFLDWINEQGRLKNFPDFGDKCQVQGFGC